MDNKTIRRINLRLLVEECGSKAKLATICGVSASNLSQVDPPGDGEPIRNIGDELARDLEIGMRKPHGWMDVSHEGDPPVPFAVHYVPVQMWKTAGDDDDAESLMVPVDSRTISPRSFGLRVRGDSMVNPVGRPSYPPGCVIIVDPDRTARDGDRVVVRIPNVPELAFKLYTVDAGRILLRSYAPQIPVMDWVDGMEVLGVVVKTIIDEV